MSKLHAGLSWDYQPSGFADESCYSSRTSVADARISLNPNSGLLLSDSQSAIIFNTDHATSIISPVVPVATDFSGLAFDSGRTESWGTVNSNLGSFCGSDVYALTIQSPGHWPSFSGTIEPTVVANLGRIGTSVEMNSYSSCGSDVQAPAIQSSSRPPSLSTANATVVARSRYFTPVTSYDPMTAGTVILPLSNPPWASDSALAATPKLSHSGSWVTDCRFVTDPLVSAFRLREPCWPQAGPIELQTQNVFTAHRLCNPPFATASPFQTELCGSLFGHIEYQVVDISGSRRVFRHIYGRTISLIERVLDLKQIGRRLLAYLNRRNPKKESTPVRLPKKSYSSLRRVNINLPLVC